MLQQLLDLGGPGAVVAGVGVVPELHGDFSLNGTQFTYITSAKVQKLTQKALLVADSPETAAAFFLLLVLPLLVQYKRDRN
jgi:hypothetical protein